MKLCLTSPLELLTNRAPPGEKPARDAPRVTVVAFPRQRSAYVMTASKLDGRATVPFRYRVRAHAPANSAS